MIFEKKVVELFTKKMLVRSDYNGAVYYFDHHSFPKLNARLYTFYGNRGQRLVGSFYYYGNMDMNRVVVFEHGMGAGHLAYMKEIELLARHGYTVLSYDHTGSGKSEGENIGGFSQSLADLDCLVKALNTDEQYHTMRISVIGHSWGAFSTLNIAALHSDVSHVVALSGFVSVRAILEQFLPSLMKLYVPAILEVERSANPEYADMNAIESLKTAKAKAMIIHSEDDKTVSFKRHFELMREALSDRADTHFLSFSDRGHNPNFTADAVKYKDEFFKDLTAKAKAGELVSKEAEAALRDSYDWDRMTEQDTELWNKIFEFLDN